MKKAWEAAEMSKVSQLVSLMFQRSLKPFPPSDVGGDEVGQVAEGALPAGSDERLRPVQADEGQADAQPDRPLRDEEAQEEQEVILPSLSLGFPSPL